MGAGTIIPPFSSEDDEGYAFLWSYNPDPIPQGEVQVFYIEGGVPPYTWTLTLGTLFSISTAVTSDQFNFIEANAIAETDDEDTVTVTDAENNVVTGLCRCCLPHPCCSEAGNDRLLLHADDQAEGAQVFTDSSNGPSSPHSNITVSYGTPTITLTDSKFGVGCISTPGNARVLVNDGVTDFDFPIGTDFIIDLWIKLYAKQNYGVVLSRSTNNVYWIAMFQGIPVVYSVFGGGLQFCSTDIGVGNWAYIYLTRVAGLLYVFVNGNKEIDGFNWNYNLVFPTQSLQLFHDGSANLAINAKIDELRIVNGEAGHTENFTPPTEPHEPGGTVYPGYSQIAWSASNPSTIEAGSLERYAVTGGCPPYQWTATGNAAVSWAKEWTARGYNTLIAIENVVSLTSVIATVTDGCGLVATSGSIGITFPPTGEDCCPRSIAWDNNNPQTILRNQTSVVGIIGGCPEFIVEVQGEDLWLDAAHTAKSVVDSSGSVTVHAGPTACGGGTITFVDTCGASANGSIRVADAGTWQQQNGINCIVSGGGFVQDNWWKYVEGMWQVWEQYSWSGAGDVDCGDAGDPCPTAKAGCLVEPYTCQECLSGFESCAQIPPGCSTVPPMCECQDVDLPGEQNGRICWCLFNFRWYKWIC